MQGRAVVRTDHFALHCYVPLESDVKLFPQQGVWLGAVLPKRWAKRAVTRNAIRRQIYAIGNQLQVVLMDQVYVVRLRAAFDAKQFVSASSDILKSAARAELLQLFSGAVKPVVP